MKKRTLKGSFLITTLTASLFFNGTVRAEIHRPNIAENSILFNSNDVPVTPSSQRPVWAIAHRVLTKNAVDAALSHGANALEIDVRYESAGPWWAAHDAGSPGRGDRLQDIFNHIVAKKNTGASISFIWLDMKTPDGCDNEFGAGRRNMQDCKMKALMDIARNTLEKRGIRVLYGFTTEDGGMTSGLAKVAASLTKEEGIMMQAGTTSSKLDAAMKKLEIYKIPVSKKIIDRGLFNPELASDSIINDLKKMVDLRNKNQIARVFGWTAVYEKHIREMLGTGADGIIYGNAAAEYTDSPGNRNLAEKIRQYANTNNLRMATASDIPFGDGRVIPTPHSRLKSLKTGECLSVNIYSNPEMLNDCDSAAEWQLVKLSENTFRIKWRSADNGQNFCLTELNGSLKVNVECGGIKNAPYQNWQWEGEYLKNGPYYLNGASLIKNVNSQNAYQVRWKLM